MTLRPGAPLRSSGRRRWCLAAASWACTARAQASDAAALPKLPDLDGRPLDLADVARRHRVLVVNFWATWCGPCITELPEFEAVYRRLHDQGLAMVGVNLGEKAEKAVPFARKLGLSFPMLMDPEGAAREGYAVFSGLPVTAVVDRKGRLRHRVAGPLTGEALRALVEPLLRES